MIGLDTNLLVRFVTQDDPIQCRQTDEIMRSLSTANQAWISLAVLLELAWTLARVYRIDRPQIIRILDGLIDRQEFRIEQFDTVHEAVRLFRKGRAEFADCLIAASARAAGCSKTVTFDRVAARDTGMELIA
jgi:predicted nucleic-acid-binding protein